MEICFLNRITISRAWVRKNFKKVSRCGFSQSFQVLGEVVALVYKNS